MIPNVWISELGGDKIMQRISRKQIVEGTRVPGIIHNDHHFYVSIEVYEDGMVNCWELVDLAGLKEKLNRGRVTPQVPEGEALSIHGLGAYRLQSAQWDYDEAGYLAHIEHTVQLLNPGMTNLYTISEAERRRQEERRVVNFAQASEFYVKEELFYQTAQGAGFTMFLKHQGKNYAANVVVYKDGRVTCYTPKFELNVKMDEVEALFKKGTLFTCFKKPTEIIFEELGVLVFDEVLYSTSPKEKYKELADAYRKLNGAKTSLEKCREAYYTYLENPSEFARARLKELYEWVPEHERMYLGDMDNRDEDYVRIIYYPEDKREV